jgi:hypothetical protein
MPKNLVEHIIDGEFVEAQANMRSLLDDIVEQKLFEMKRSIDLTERVEATGGHDEDGNPLFKGQNNKSDWKEYRKQNKGMSFYGTPSNPRARASKNKHEKTSTGSLTKHGIAMRRKRGYLPANDAINAKKFIDGVSDYLEKKKGLKETASYKRPKIPKFLSGTDARRRRASSAPDSSSSSSTTRKPTDFISKMNQAGKDADKYKMAPDVRQGMSQAGQEAQASKDAYKAERRTKAVGTIKKVGQFAADVFSTPWEESYQMQEVLGPNASAGTYIHDFEHSKNKMFKGDSKEQRRKRAIAAYMHNKDKLEEAKWKDIPKGKKAHPFGRPKNVIKIRRLRARKLGKRTFNEE